MFFFHLSTPLVFLFLLSSCSLLPDPESPPQLVQLTAPPLVHRSSIPLSKILIAPAQTESFLDTYRLSLLQPHYFVDYYAGVSWTNSLPKIFQELLLKTFEKVDALTLLKSNTPLSPPPVYILSTEIRSFSANYRLNNPPMIEIHLKVELSLAHNKRLLKRDFLSAHVQAYADTMTSITDAFAKATHEILQKMVEWTLSHLPPSSICG